MDKKREGWAQKNASVTPPGKNPTVHASDLRVRDGMVWRVRAGIADALSYKDPSNVSGGTIVGTRAGGGPGVGKRPRLLVAGVLKSHCCLQWLWLLRKARREVLVDERAVGWKDGFLKRGALFFSFLFVVFFSSVG